ncbi:hypothetical protein [Cohnella hongkongensis]|uniref:Uncharacterized protein n=1 Tax=Cohnella hongkongensis TaxID=178337 RepID=A0ABV9F8K3_9BACL
MPKLRSTEAKPLTRKTSADPKAKLSASPPPSPKNPANKGNKKETDKGEVVHLHQSEDEAPQVTRPIPWWVFPQEQERGLLGGPASGTGGMEGPGGPGGPGLGPGFFPSPPPFPGPAPGPGPFPTPPPFPGSGPIPLPIPVPIPVPGPLPVPPAFITVWITGGTAFPRVHYTRYVPYFPGITIRQALASTGLVDFGPAGFIRNVAGIPIFETVEVRLRYNGRIFPQTLLNAPAEPGSIVGLELHYSSTGAIPIPL